MYGAPCGATNAGRSITVSASAAAPIGGAGAAVYPGCQHKPRPGRTDTRRRRAACACYAARGNYNAVDHSSSQKAASAIGLAGAFPLTTLCSVNELTE